MGRIGSTMFSLAPLGIHLEPINKELMLLVNNYNYLCHLAQRKNSAVPNKKLYGPMVYHMSLYQKKLWSTHKTKYLSLSVSLSASLSLSLSHLLFRFQHFSIKFPPSQIVLVSVMHFYVQFLLYISCPPFCLEFSA